MHRRKLGKSMIFVYPLLALFIGGCNTTGKNFDEMIGSTDYEDATSYYLAEQEYFSKKKDSYKASVATLAKSHVQLYRDKISENQSSLLQNAIENPVPRDNWVSTKNALSNIQRYFKTENKDVKLFRQIHPDLFTLIDTDYKNIKSNTLCRSLHSKARKAIAAYDLVKEKEFFDVYPSCGNDKKKRSSLLSHGLRSNKIDFNGLNKSNLLKISRKYESYFTPGNKNEIANALYRIHRKENVNRTGRDTVLESLAAIEETKKQGYEPKNAALTVFLGSHNSTVAVRTIPSKLDNQDVPMTSVDAIKRAARTPMSIVMLPAANRRAYDKGIANQVYSKYVDSVVMVENPKYREALNKLKIAESRLYDSQSALNAADSRRKEMNNKNESLAQNGASLNSVRNIAILSSISSGMDIASHRRQLRDSQSELRKTQQKVDSLPRQAEKKLYRDYSYEAYESTISKYTRLHGIVYNASSNTYDVYKYNIHRSKKFNRARGIDASDKKRTDYNDPNEESEWFNAPIKLDLQKELKSLFKASNLTGSNLSELQLDEIVRDIQQEQAEIEQTYARYRAKQSSN